MAASGSALIRRRLRQSFGIAAQRVSIRTELPWRWRTLVWVIIVSSSLVLAAWMYDVGRRFAGFDRSETSQEILRLQTQVVALEEELDKLRAFAHTSDSRLQVETTTQSQLATQIKALQHENAALKEDLGVFEALVAGGSLDGGPRLARVSLEASGKKGVWHYRVLIVNSGVGKDAQETRGSLQFELNTRQNDKDVSILIPGQGAGQSAYQFSVKNFRRIDGDFVLPSGSILTSGEVRLIQAGAIRARRALSL